MPTQHILQGIFPTQGLICSTTKINTSKKKKPQNKVKQAQASYPVLPRKPPPLSVLTVTV